jgi:hypothetical protein
MRPGYLYFSIFIWLVCTGGRFTAPFLKEVARFDDSMIGIAVAVQILLSSFLGSIGSVYADRLEFKYPNGGRIAFLAGGLTLSTLSFMIHGLVFLLVDEEEQHLLCIGMHMVARVMYACFSSVIFPILDGITLSYLKKHQGGSVSYGKERLFGAVAWAIVSIVLGPLLDSFGFGVFFLSAPAGCLIGLFTIAKFGQECIDYERITEENTVNSETEMVEKRIIEQDEILSDEDLDEFEDNKEHSTPEIGSMYLLRAMISTYTACGFIISSLTLNMGTSVVESLIFLYFESLGGSYTICGLTVLVTVIFEIPIFHYAPRLLTYFGAEALQKIACVAYIFRVVAYTCIPQGHIIFVLFFEPLHGVTYACSKTSSVEFAARISPTGYESSSQGLISLIFGLGSVVGVSLGGWIEEALGPEVLYRSYAGIVTIGLVIFYVTISMDARLSPNREIEHDTCINTTYRELSKKQSMEESEENHCV